MKAIIFDLGGVLYEISEAEFRAQMLQLAQTSGLGVAAMAQKREAFLALGHAFERGELTEAAFLHQLQTDYFPQAHPADILAAWNSILIGPYPHSFKLVPQVKKRMPVYLLSNTNSLHFKQLAPEMKDVFAHFDFLYLSYEVNARKPDAQIYTQVADQIGLPPNQLLFIDDSDANITTAAQVGYNTLHLPDAATLPAQLAQLGLL
jgi:putative hydrolase of the HAD superfamily